MIDLILRTQAEFQQAEDHRSPDRFLDPFELDMYRALRYEKRRQDWLLGRWTAKTLAAQVVGKYMGFAVPPIVLRIIPDEMGAPKLFSEASEFTGPLPFSISISHSAGRAACGMIPSRAGSVRLGIDLELIANRPAGFAADYFTAKELAAIRQLPEGSPGEAVGVTAIWSMKEAVLKALRLGLVVDTRSVICSLQPPAHVPVGWQACNVRLSEALKLNPAPVLRAWWSVVDGFVLSVALACFYGAEQKLNISSSWI